MTALDEVVAAIGQCIDAGNDSENRTARVADLLLDFVGPPSRDGVNCGTDIKIKAVADEVKNRFESIARRFASFDYLRQLRRTAFRFSPGERPPGIPFSLLVIARDPQTLHAAMTQASDEGRKCSAGYIKKFRQAREAAYDNENEAIDLIFFTETKRRFVETIRYIARPDLPAERWTEEQRCVLAENARELTKALAAFVRVVEPMRRAA